MHRTRLLLAGFAVALAFAAGWVALTAATEATYHLAPLIAGAAPGAVTRAAERPAAPLAAALAGALAATIGWVVIAAAGIEPSATLVEDQPGGVSGEVAVGGLLGAAIGFYLVPRGQARGA